MLKSKLFKYLIFCALLLILLFSDYLYIGAFVFLSIFFVIIEKIIEKKNKHNDNKLGSLGYIILIITLIIIVLNSEYIKY